MQQNNKKTSKQKIKNIQKAGRKPRFQKLKSMFSKKPAQTIVPAEAPEEELEEDFK